MKPYRFVARILSLGIAIASPFALSQQGLVTIPHVGSGHAALRQQGHLTILELSSPKSPLQRIFLTHPSDRFQGTNAPYRARLIAEDPHHFLVFTDTFASNPGNPQGECGASESGERFVHVVALGAYPHETLSILVDSCLLNIESAAGSPQWYAKPDSAGSVGQLILRFEPETQLTTVYYVSSDGSISRPKARANP
jgi:hypothetical protein